MPKNTLKLQVQLAGKIGAIQGEVHIACQQIAQLQPEWLKQLEKIELDIAAIQKQQDESPQNLNTATVKSLNKQYLDIAKSAEKYQQQLHKMQRKLESEITLKMAQLTDPLPNAQTTIEQLGQDIDKHLTLLDDFFKASQEIATTCQQLVDKTTHDKQLAKAAKQGQSFEKTVQLASKSSNMLSQRLNKLNEQSLTLKRQGMGNVIQAPPLLTLQRQIHNCGQQIDQLISTTQVEDSLEETTDNIVQLQIG